VKKGLFASVLALLVLGTGAPVAQGAMSWDVPSFDFGSQEAGVSSAPRTFTLTATCTAGAGTCMTPAGGIHSYGAVTTPGADFGIDTTDCSGMLFTPVFPGPSTTCTARVTFKPSSTGPKTGVLDTATGPDVALTGIGVVGGSGNKDGAGGKKCTKKKKGKRSASASKKKKKCKKRKKKN